MSDTIEIPKPQNIDQVKKELLDTRDISKKQDPQGRSDTASTILNIRADSRSTQAEIAQKEAGLKSIDETVPTFLEKRADQRHALYDRNDTLLVKLKRKFGIGDKQTKAIQATINTLDDERYALGNQSMRTTSELRALSQKQTKIPDPKEALAVYYEKIATRPLTVEEKRELLTPEVLSALSIEEYIALWRRLNPYFLTHVTRQGFRDHNAMFYHSAGMQAFHAGFTNVLGDRKLLRPPLEVHALHTRDDTGVKDFLDNYVLEAPTEAEARMRLDQSLHETIGDLPKYQDMTAIHFAGQTVLNSYYGGEKRNEIFYVYPSDFVASQYNFSGGFGSYDYFTKGNDDEMRNDILLWPQDLNNSGVPLDAGIVFLPESTVVDPETGSKYASEIKIIDGEETRIMIEDTEQIKALSGWLKTLESNEDFKAAFEKYRHAVGEDVLISKNVAIELFRKLIFQRDVAIDLSDALFDSLIQWNDYYLDDSTIQDLIRGSGAAWKRAEKTIPAKQYWESYFDNNPQLRPKHIYYYDGNPTTAVYDFLRKHDIGRAETSVRDGKLLGFEDHFVQDIQNDPRAKLGYDELLEKANKIIAEHYQEKAA